MTGCAVHRDSRGKLASSYEALEISLASGDPGVLGVMACLATVEDDDIARVLSLAVGSSLATLVVEDAAARKRVSAAIERAGHKKRCDMLAMTMVTQFQSGTGGAEASACNVGDRRACLCLRARQNEEEDRWWFSSWRRVRF